MQISKIMLAKIIFTSFSIGFILSILIIALLGWLNDIAEDREKAKMQLELLKTEIEKNDQRR